MEDDITDDELPGWVLKLQEAYDGVAVENDKTPSRTVMRPKKW